MTIINAGVMNTGTGDINVTGSVVGHQIVGQRFNGPVDAAGAHFGRGDIHNHHQPLNSYQAVVVTGGGTGGFAYSFPAPDDSTATTEFDKSMDGLPGKITARLYRLDGDDRHEVSTWPRKD